VIQFVGTLFMYWERSAMKFRGLGCHWQRLEKILCAVGRTSSASLC